MVVDESKVCIAAQLKLRIVHVQLQVKLGFCIYWSPILLLGMGLSIIISVFPFNFTVKNCAFNSSTSCIYIYVKYFTRTYIYDVRTLIHYTVILLFNDT